MNQIKSKSHGKQRVNKLKIKIHKKIGIDDHVSSHKNC